MGNIHQRGLTSGHLVGAVCGSAARTDLDGGRWVTSVPTATPQGVRNSQLSVVVSLFFKLFSLIGFVGNSSRRACNEGTFRIGFSLSQAE